MPEPSRPLTPPHPVWTPIHEVARNALGMSADLALSAIERGQLPIRVARFGGRGLVFVNTADTAAYVQAQQGCQR